MLKVQQIKLFRGGTELIKIDKTGLFRLTDRLDIQGINATVTTTKNFDQYGDSWKSSNYDPLDFELHFMIKGDGTFTTYKNARRTISQVFAPHLGEMEMSVMFEDNSILYKTVVPDSVPYFPTNFANSNAVWQNVIAPLTAHNPFWHEAETRTAWADNLQHQVINNGDIPVGFRLSFDPNPTTNLIVITNVTTGEWISFKNLDGALVSIDTRSGKKDIIIGGVHRWDDVLVSSTMFQLVQGINSIKIEGSNVVNVELYHNNTYLTV